MKISSAEMSFYKGNNTKDILFSQQKVSLPSSPFFYSHTHTHKYKVIDNYVRLIF